MKRTRLLWKLFPVHLLITLLALIALSVYTSNSLHKFFLNESFADLEARALLVEDEIKDLLFQGKMEQLNDLCKKLGEKSSTRITVILISGEVSADSLEQIHSTPPMGRRRTGDPKKRPGEQDLPFEARRRDISRYDLCRHR